MENKSRISWLVEYTDFIGTEVQEAHAPEDVYVIDLQVQPKDRADGSVVLLNKVHNTETYNSSSSRSTDSLENVQKHCRYLEQSHVRLKRSGNHW